MAANGISTHLPKSDRANLKLALSETIRSTLPPTVVDNNIGWMQQIYEPETYNPPQAFTYWHPNTVFSANVYIDVNGVFYKSNSSGTSGSIEPTWTQYFGYRPLHVIDQPEVNPPRPTPLVQGRPWDL